MWTDEGFINELLTPQTEESACSVAELMNVSYLIRSVHVGAVASGPFHLSKLDPHTGSVTRQMFGSGCVCATKSYLTEF